MPRIRKDLVDKDLSYTIVGIFYEVHNDLGRYCREKQYGDALEIIFKDRGLSYKRELALEVAGRKSSFIDFCVADRIVIEMKTKQVIDKNDYLQLQSYLTSANKELGLLVNFRQRVLRPKRVLNSKYIKD